MIEGAQAACEQLQHAPGDLGLLTTVRRAFHTLKGSGRMVGLKSFGEAAWACEQVFNTQLAEQRAAEPPLIEFATWVLGHLSGWVEDIAAHRDGERSEGEVKLAADRVARRLATGEGSSDIALPMGLPPGLAERRRSSARRAAAAPAEAPEPPPKWRSSSTSRASSAPTRPRRRWASCRRSTTPLRRCSIASTTPARSRTPDQARTTIVDAPFDMTSGPIDLDLGVPTDAAPLIELLEPSDTASPATPDLLLDLSSVDALPDAARTSASRPMPLAPRPSRRADRRAEPAAASSEPAIEEHVKVVGPLRISIPLFNIYLNEADELSRRLTTEVAEWAMELHRPLGETPIALAHSLAGSSATVGFTDLSHLARSLEHALARSQVIGHGTDEEARLFVQRRRGDPAPAAPVRRRLPEGARSRTADPPRRARADLGAPPRGGDRGFRARRRRRKRIPGRCRARGRAADEPRHRRGRLGRRGLRRAPDDAGSARRGRAGHGRHCGAPAGRAGGRGNRSGTDRGAARDRCDRRAAGRGRSPAVAPAPADAGRPRPRRPKRMRRASPTSRRRRACPPSAPWHRSPGSACRS